MRQYLKKRIKSVKRVAQHGLARFLLALILVIPIALIVYTTYLVICLVVGLGYVIINIGLAALLLLLLIQFIVILQEL